MNPKKNVLFFNLAKSHRDEPPITNEEFLRSYFQVGVSLRIVTLYQQHMILRSPDSTPLERFAAVCAFFQTLGTLYEDIAATAVCWAAWSKDRTLLLADLYERTKLMSQPETSHSWKRLS